MEYNGQLSLFDNLEPHALSDSNEISLLALAEVPGVGFGTIRALYEALGGRLSKVWDIEDKLLYEYLYQAKIPQPNQLVTQIKDQSKKVIAKAQEQYLILKRRNVSIVFRETPLYPQSLYELKSAPAWLFVEGNVKLLNDPAIAAVVGTREPTELGMQAAKYLSILLIRCGYVILSGLALGIDEIGHRSSVDYGSPTIGVLGHGIDIVYPAATANLRRQIIERGGAVVSEYLPKDMYNRERFVQRNRIQAALAKVVAVIEGKSKSGTAHTVRFARELDRPLFGVQIGSSIYLEQREVLEELIKHDDPVFDLDNRSDREKLYEYLKTKLPLDAGLRSLHRPSLFQGLLFEIDRLSRSYGAKEGDFDWLIDQINQYRDKSLRRVGNDNSSHHT